jgi:hypothetical protein
MTQHHWVSCSQCFEHSRNLHLQDQTFGEEDLFDCITS